LDLISLRRRLQKEEEAFAACRKTPEELAKDTVRAVHALNSGIRSVLLISRSGHTEQAFPSQVGSNSSAFVVIFVLVI
jgi:hypothetical protein